MLNNLFVRLYKINSKVAARTMFIIELFLVLFIAFGLIFVFSLIK